MPLYTGALPSPPHVVYNAIPFRAMAGAPTSYFKAIPKQVSTWGNTQYGDCVTAEECWAKAAYSAAAGVDPVFVTEADCIAWARSHRYLNGATLTDVMDSVAQDGLPAGGKKWTDGSYRSVDWTDYATVVGAIFTGPVKIAVGSGPLSRVVTPGQNGFFVPSAHTLMSDHCVGLGGYGTVSECFDALKASMPNGADPKEPALILFTWGSIGVVTHRALVGMTTEAWVRNPTTPEHRAPTDDPVDPLPPFPDPLPVPGGQILIDPINRTIHAPDGWRLV